MAPNAADKKPAEKKPAAEKTAEEEKEKPDKALCWQETQGREASSASKDGARSEKKKMVTDEFTGSNVIVEACQVAAPVIVRFDEPLLQILTALEVMDGSICLVLEVDTQSLIAPWREHMVRTIAMDIEDLLREQRVLNTGSPITVQGESDMSTQ